MSVIDFHSHVLPGIDDGSADTETSIRMLRESVRQGVEKIIATPHFYAQKDSVEHFLECRDRSVCQLCEAVAALQDGRDSAPDTEQALRDVEIPKLFTGAEVYYFSGMGRAAMLPQLCITGTNMLLLEMPFRQWGDGVVEDVRTILTKRGLTVILAHIERYYSFQRKKDAWQSVMELPLYKQLNAGCFLDFWQRRFGVKILKKGWEVLLGSDCHNMERRAPNLGEGRDVIRRKLGEPVLEEIDELGSRLLRGAVHIRYEQ